MARRVVRSEATGETYIFDDDWNEADGRVRQIEYMLGPGKSVPPHFHPATAQSFEVLAGALSVRVGGRKLVLGPGDRAMTAAGEAHAQWNDGPEDVRVIEGYDPPIAIEPFFTVMPHAMGSKNPLKIAVFLAEFRDVDQPATAGLRIFVAIFAVLGRLVGLGGWYRPLLIQAGLRPG
jgi:quercetin dioxygenase-like cupin family protein